MSSIEFRAPWSKTLRTATIVSLIVLAAVFAGGIVAAVRAPSAVALIPIGLPILVIGVTLPFAVRGYALTAEEILVKRAGWTTHLPLAGLQSVTGDNEAMRGSIRLLGNGGLFSFTGSFWNRRLGRYRALATDPDRAVVLRYAGRKVVITPHDPQQFIMRARTLLQSEKSWSGNRPGVWSGDGE